MQIAKFQSQQSTNFRDIFVNRQTNGQTCDHIYMYLPNFNSVVNCTTNINFTITPSQQSLVYSRGTNKKLKHI